MLDVGCGAGYLCRKLAKSGAIVTGVELCDKFFELASKREAESKLNISYHHASVCDMRFLASNSFDAAVSNYVLMDVPDYIAAVREISRVLRKGGKFVAVISHPAFSSGPQTWFYRAPDTPYRWEREAFMVDDYFRRGPTICQWGDLDPVLGFHRPLRDYWQVSGMECDGLSSIIFLVLFC